MKFFRKQRKNRFGWFGDYSSWDEVVKKAVGYDAQVILEKTLSSLLKVKRGEAVYERDSVLFDKKVYPFPLIAALLHISDLLGRPFSLIDFGGSLGSTYFQVKEFFPPSVCRSWNIVEQPHYIEVGNRELSDDVLKFYSSIEECLVYENIDIVILSGVVQCLEKPYSFLENLLTYDFPYLLFDRTAFWKGDKDRLTLQIVPPEIYDASYPSWFFNENRFLKIIESKYSLIFDFPSYVEGEQVTYIDDKPVGYDKGFFMVKK